MRPTRHHRRHSALAVPALLLVIAAGATACGDDSSGDDADDTRDRSSGDTSGTLSADQVEQAVLSLDNLGEGWKEEDVDDDEDDDEDGPGCFGEISKVTEDLDPVEKAEKKYGYGDQGLPQVNTKVSTFDDADTVAGLFDEVEKTAEGCTDITYSEDGFDYDLDVRTLTDLDLDDIDDQFSLTASGTITSGDDSGKMYLYYTMVRVGPTVASIATTGLQDVNTEQQQVVKVGAARLVAVAAGEEPEATTIPAP